MIFKKLRESLKLSYKVILSLVIFGILLVAYGAFIERGWIEETEYTVEAPGWQGREARLAVLADIHAHPYDGAYLDEVVKRTLALKPDAVLLLGDYMCGRPGNPFISSMEEAEIAEHLKPLTAVPCFAVLGNHDHWHDPAALTAALEGIGIHLMEGRRERLMIDNQPLDIGGIRCLFTFRTPGKVPQPQAGVPMVLLSHTPYGTSFAPRGTLITVSGHLHGGQVCLPGIGALFSIDPHVPLSRTAGAHTLKDGRLEYVSRGVGTSVLPIRLFCRPELLLLRIRGQKE